MRLFPLTAEQRIRCDAWAHVIAPRLEQATGQVWRQMPMDPYVRPGKPLRIVWLLDAGEGNGKTWYASIPVPSEGFEHLWDEIADSEVAVVMDELRIAGMP